MDFSYQSRRKSAWWIWNPTDTGNDRAVTPFYGRCGQDQKSRRKARAGEPVTIAYIGGSITQGAGAVPLHTQCYAYRFWKAFAGKYGKNNNVKLIKAGVGGTPSELGMDPF